MKHRTKSDNLVKEAENMMNLLVVDDDPVVRMTLRTILTAEGHTITTAADAETALFQWDEQHHDMIITDLVMPLMGGTELRDSVRTRPEGKTTPVLFISGLDDSTALSVVRNPNIEGYYKKGSSLEDLFGWIGYLADGKGGRHVSPQQWQTQVRPGSQSLPS